MAVGFIILKNVVCYYRSYDNYYIGLFIVFIPING